jgi:hypothetical protein
MKDAPNGIYVRIVSVEGMRVTVSSTHPGDFALIGEPPFMLGKIEITGRGRLEKMGFFMVFSAKNGQSLVSLGLNKRYMLLSC